MDLEDFVAESLRQIVSGVSRAQRETHSMGARIYPLMFGTRADGSRLTGEDAEGNSRPAYEVKFDVAVTVSASTGSGAEMKARLHILEAGIGGKSANENTTASRVSFSIPVVYPVHSGERAEWKEGATNQGVSTGLSTQEGRRS